MKPRLLFVSNLFPDAAEPYRGLDNATVLHQLAAAYEVRVVSPRPWLPLRSQAWPKKPRPVDVTFAPDFVRCPYLPKIGSLANHHLMAAALRTTLRKLHGQFPWDRVLGSWLYPDGCALQKAVSEITPSAPITLIAQGSDVHVYLRSRLRRRAILQTLSHVSGTITRSRSLAELLAQAGADPTKLHPICNGVDTSLFHPNDRAEVRAELQLDPTETVLLFVGNFLPVKDPFRLVHHFQHLTAQLPKHRLRLVMIGKGPLEPGVDELIQSTGPGLKDRIQRTGPLLADGVARWMRAADLLCMTSRNEGLPNVILEAQACGLPVLGTAVGGLHEVVDEPWKGSLTPLDDLPAWEAAASRLIEKPLDRERIAALGSTRTWTAAAEAYHQVIECP
jgi:glycosyltransferase involved in cell wall biosynthesis